jgi:hypothetical protein
MKLQPIHRGKEKLSNQEEYNVCIRHLDKLSSIRTFGFNFMLMSISDVAPIAPRFTLKVVKK